VVSTPEERAVQHVNGQVRLEQVNARPDESEFYELAKTVPSSAGFYMNSTGAMVVQVRDQVEDDRARQAMTSLRGSGRVKLAHGQSTPVVLQRVQFSFVQLAVWRDRLSESVLVNTPGVLTLDLDEVANRVVIGVDDARMEQVRVGILSRLAAFGIDAAAVVFRRTQPLRLQRAMAPRPPLFVPSSLTSTTDTIIGGLIIGIPGGGGLSLAACTLGFVATWNGTPGFVTASHCSTNQFGTDGSVALQDPYGRQIGYETNDPSGYFCSFNTCRGSDASFFTMSAGINSLRGLIARPSGVAAPPGTGGGPLTINSSHPYFIVNGVDAGFYYVGMNVQKVGRTTGWTSGSLTATCVDHYNGNWPGADVTRCAYQASYTDEGGDSGGPVFTFPGYGGPVGDLVELGGVHFGNFGLGSAVFSKYSRIASDFGGTLVATRPITLGTPSVSGTIAGGNPSFSWNAISGATRYQIIRVTADGSTVRNEYLATTTGTSYVDSYTLATAYNGTTPFNDGGPWAYYEVIALGGATELSARSTAIHYRTTLTCSGKC